VLLYFYCTFQNTLHMSQRGQRHRSGPVGVEVSFRSGSRTLKGVLFGESRQDAPALVLCHGAFEPPDNWYGVAEELARRGFSVLVFGFTGHGKSEGVPSTVDMDLWSEDARSAVAFVRQRGFAKVGLVGWSSGASAAVKATAEVPVDFGVMIDGTYKCLPSLGDRVMIAAADLVGKVKRFFTGRPLTMGGEMLKTLDKMTWAKDTKIDAAFKQNPAVRQYWSNAPFPGCRDVAVLDISHHAASVRLPVMLIHGEDDQVDRADEARAFYQQLGSELKDLQILPDCGHLAHQEKREEVLDLIERWTRASMAIRS
jgi:pimeloyl-ACP methyl ester carboxylesterase